MKHIPICKNQYKIIYLETKGVIIRKLFQLEKLQPADGILSSGKPHMFIKLKV